MKVVLFIVASLILLSTAAYAQWVQANVPGGGVVMSFASIDTNLFAATGGAGVFRSTNGGISWAPVNSGLTSLNALALATNGTNLYADTWDGMSISTDDGKNWTSMNSSSTIQDVISAIIASDTNVFVGTLGEGVFLTTNNGASWTAGNSGLTNLNVHAFARKDSNLFVGTDRGVFRTTNNGASWTEVDTGISDTCFTALMTKGSYLYAGTSFGHVYISTNNGSTWNTNSIFLNPNIDAIAAQLDGKGDTTLFAGTNGGGVYKSTNDGTSWSKVNTGLTAVTAFSLIEYGTSLFAGTEVGVFLTTNDGAN